MSGWVIGGRIGGEWVGDRVSGWVIGGSEWVGRIGVGG